MVQNPTYVPANDPGKKPSPWMMSSDLTGGEIIQIACEPDTRYKVLSVHRPEKGGSTEEVVEVDRDGNEKSNVITIGNELVLCHGR